MAIRRIDRHLDGFHVADHVSIGAGYPPDETFLLPELSGTTIRQLASVGVGLVVLSAGLIATRRRRHNKDDE